MRSGLRRVGSGIRRVGSGLRRVGSGITAPGSGITSHGIGISSFVLRDQGYAAVLSVVTHWEERCVTTIRDQAVLIFMDQGPKSVTLLQSRIRNLGTILSIPETSGRLGTSVQ